MLQRNDTSSIVHVTYSETPVYTGHTFCSLAVLLFVCSSCFLSPFLCWSRRSLSLDKASSSFLPWSTSNTAKRSVIKTLKNNQTIHKHKNCGEVVLPLWSSWRGSFMERILLCMRLNTALLIDTHNTCFMQRSVHLPYLYWGCNIFRKQYWHGQYFDYEALVMPKQLKRFYNSDYKFPTFYVIQCHTEAYPTSVAYSQ